MENLDGEPERQSPRAAGTHLNMHSSLLSVFGLSATSTYDSYLPLIFEIFGMI